MKYSNNSGEVSPGASSHAERRSDCKCISSINYYDCSGSLDAYDPSFTCTPCIEAFVRDVEAQFGSISAMEDECQYHVHPADEAHFYLTRKYSIHYCYYIPNLCSEELDVDDLPF